MGGPSSRPLAHSIMGGGGGLGSGGGGAGVGGLASGVIGAQAPNGSPLASPFGVVGFEPSTAAASGKYKGEFTSMTSLAAACSTLGDIAYLVGQTTGEIICLCRRVDAGDPGIAWQGMVEVLQADGTEFDGAFAWDPIGAAADPTWGVAGVESTGGVNPAAGALRLGGFMPFKGLRRSVFAEWYVEALPTTPATADSLLAGLLPAAATTSDYYAGGAGYNSGTIRSVVSANGNPSSPGLAYSGTGGALSVANKIQTHFDGFKYSSTDDASFYSGGWSQGNNSPGTPPTGAAGSLDASGDTFNFTISKVNDWNARLIRFGVLPVYG